MTSAPQAEKTDKLCPLLKKQLHLVCHKCAWYMLIRGKHPQTGADVDQWGCAVSWLPMLMIENAQVQRQTGAAVEDFRNNLVEAVGGVQAAMTAIAEGGQGARPIQINGGDKH